MPRHVRRHPAYRLHRSSGQAVVTLDGRDFYLGPYGSKASRAEYDRLISQWLANGRKLPGDSVPAPDLTVNELLLAYLRFAEGYYVKNGKVTSEYTCVNGTGFTEGVRTVGLLVGWQVPPPSLCAWVHSTTVAAGWPATAIADF